MVLALLFIFLFGCIVAVIFSFNALFNTLRFGLPFVTTPQWVVDWLQNNLTLGKDDIVYELGCGDARVLASIAVKHPLTKFVGVEIQWWPWLLAKWRTSHLKNVQIIYGDVFKLDLSPATIIYGFFITGFMPKLATKLKNNLRPGTKIISFGFRLPDWATEQEITNPQKPSGSRILIYRR